MSAALTVTAVRVANERDLAQLTDVETAADAVFADLGRAVGIPHTEFPPATPGPERSAHPGVVLVAGDPVVGFAHVAILDGAYHLEQLSVLPEWHGRGVGATLLRAALGWALDAGAPEITLMTFADVAWNAPYYARHGFTVIDRDDPPHIARLREVEDRLGMHRWGPRVAMRRELRDEPAPIPAVSVIPLREGTTGLEAFVQLRATTMDFAAGAVVFPGGRIDPGDRASDPGLPLPTLTGHAFRWAETGAATLTGTPHSAARALIATGVREVAEETGARIDPAALIPWDNWITPIDVAKRFDVYFFVLPVAGDGSDWRNTTTEARWSGWLPVTEVARAAEAGEILLLAPTRSLVAELVALGGLDRIRMLEPGIAAVRHDIDGPRPRRGLRKPL